MITNLFSIFDPSSSLFYMQFNWLRALIGILLIPNAFWIIPNRLRIFLWKIYFNIHLELKTLLNSKFKGNTLIFISLFYFLLINNFLGLFPYIFTATSHLVVSLSLAIPFWLAFIIYGWIINTQIIFIHLVPQGTPSALIIFMVCIESIRNLIRPWTLAIRLSANIIAGHLLITLLGNTGIRISFYLIFILLIIQILLIILEAAVAIIQSYVFTVLTSIYSREVIN